MRVCVYVCVPGPAKAWNIIACNEHVHVVSFHMQACTQPYTCNSIHAFTHTYTHTQAQSDSMQVEVMRFTTSILAFTHTHSHTHTHTHTHRVTACKWR